MFVLNIPVILKNGISVNWTVLATALSSGDPFLDGEDGGDGCNNVGACNRPVFIIDEMTPLLDINRKAEFVQIALTTGLNPNDNSDPSSRTIWSVWSQEAKKRILTNPTNGTHV